MSATEIDTLGVLSGSITCPRRGWYAAQNTPESNPPSTETLLRFKRGRVVEQMIMAEIAPAYEARGMTVEQQRRIRFPANAPPGEHIGYGHCDGYIVEEQHVVEVYSTKEDVTADDIARKALQAAAYALEDPEATRASLIIVDRNTFDYKVMRVNIAGLAAKWRAIKDQLVLAAETGSPPERVCESPRSGPAFTCPHRDTCFSGWVAPPDPIRQAAELAPDLERLLAAEDAIRKYGSAATAAKQARDEIRARLLASGLKPKETITAGGITASYSQSKPSSTFSLARYRALGHEVTDDMLACVKDSDGTKRWSVERT